MYMCTYTHMYMHVYIHVYIYIERERDVYTQWHV